MDFIDILASTLHDTKNSLGLLSNTLTNIIERCQGQDHSLSREFSLLQYEIKRLNHNQIRLLTLYKEERAQFSLNLDYHSVIDIIEDVALQNEPLLSSRGIDIEIDCHTELLGVFDRALVSGILDNALNNSFRYSKERVRISACNEDNYLLFKVEDDGPGYPPSMQFNHREGESLTKCVDFKTGSTTLGLYFAKLVAQYHRSKDRAGFISITNHSIFGGGVFALYLPHNL